MIVSQNGVLHKNSNRFKTMVETERMCLDFFLMNKRDSKIKGTCWKFFQHENHIGKLLKMRECVGFFSKMTNCNRKCSNPEGLCYKMFQREGMC